MEIAGYIAQNEDHVFSVLKELRGAFSPLHFEEKRAEYCENCFDSIGAAIVRGCASDDDQAF